MTRAQLRPPSSPARDGAPAPGDRRPPRAACASTPPAIRRAQARAPDRRGRGRLARLLGDDVRTRSGLERQMRRLAHHAGLPPPLVNHRVLGHERDFTWPGHRLVVEVDGGPYHAPPASREADHEPAAVLAVVSRALVARRYP